MNLNFKSALKVIGVVALIFVALPLLQSVTQNFSDGIRGQSSGSLFGNYASPQQEMAMDVAGGSAGFARTSKMMAPVPVENNTYGDDAEDFEVTQYNASFRSGNTKEVCQKLADLKVDKAIIFEQANTSQHSCDFRFKVKLESVDAVLATLKSLKPHYLNANTYSIQKGLQNLDSQSEILTKRLVAIETTLQGAMASYDEISKIATQSQNAEALATIIDSKVRLIERLTQERTNTNAQLDRLAKSQAEQLDRLAYTVFSVNVHEYKLFDFKQIKEDWHNAFKQFVFTANTIVQGLTINLIVLVLWILQYLLYAIILLHVAKFAWKHGKKVWYS